MAEVLLWAGAVLSLPCMAFAMEAAVSHDEEGGPFLPFLLWLLATMACFGLVFLST